MHSWAMRFARIALGEQLEKGTPWSLMGDPIHKLDILVAYRAGRPNARHGSKLDAQNAQASVYRYFDRRTSTVKDVTQLTLLPVLQYTLRF